MATVLFSFIFNKKKHTLLLLFMYLICSQLLSHSSRTCGLEKIDSEIIEFNIIQAITEFDLGNGIFTHLMTHMTVSL